MLQPNDAADLLNVLAKRISPEVLLDFKPRPQQPLYVTAFFHLTDEITISVKDLGDTTRNTKLYRRERDAAIDRQIKILRMSKTK